MRTGRVLRSAGVVVALAAAAATLSVAPVAADPPVPTPVTGEVGTIDTLAGPGFCDGPARIDPGALVVRAVTVDRTGTVSSLAGRPGHDVITRVGGAELLTTLPVSKVTEGADEASSGVMAPDGKGEVFLSKGTRIVHIGQPLEPDDPTLAASFTRIRALAADDAANLYVADQIEAGREAVAIRFVNRSAEPVTFHGGTAAGVVVGPRSVGTIAGAPGDVDGGQGGPADREVIVGAPISLAASAGRLYVATQGPTGRLDRPHGRVRAVNLGAEPLTAHGVEVAAGAVATVAGGGRPNDNGEGMPATAADLGALPGIGADGEGNLLLAEESRHRVRRVDRSGVITTVAGMASTGGPGSAPVGGGFNGNERPATRARLNRPVDVESSPNGVLYIADAANGMVRSVDGTGTIRTAIGSGLAAASVCDIASPGAPPPGARLGSLQPTNLAVDDDGSTWFVASALGRVMRLDAAGTVTPVTDQLTGCTGTAPCDDTKGRPRVARASAVALGAGGALYILDGGDNRVLVLNRGRSTLEAHGVTVKAGEVQTVAGNGKIGRRGDGGPATLAQLSGAGSVTLDGRGNLVIADTGNAVVRQVDAKGVITTLLPSTASGQTGCCQSPALVVRGPADALYVVESRGGVWLLNRGTAEITAHGQAVPPGAATLVAGGGGYGIGAEDVAAAGAKLQGISGLAVDGKGNLFLAEGGSSIRRVDARGTLTTVAGTGAPSFNGDGIKARLTALSAPGSLAVDRCGNLLIADTGNDRVRRLNLEPTCPELAVPGSGFAGSRRMWVLVVAGGGALGALAVVSRRRSRRLGPA